MDSHGYAEVLIQTANHLLSRPKVEFDSAGPFVFVRFTEKAKFTDAARAMGTGKKEFTSYHDLHFSPEGTCLVLSIGRDQICRKIQEAKYECEPILSAEEVESLGVAASEPSEADIPF